MEPANATALVQDALFLEHDTGPGHAERPDRLRGITRALDAAPWRRELLDLRAKPCPEEWILRAHTRGHLDSLRRTCAAAPAFLDPDTPVSRRSCEAAEAAAGAVLVACDAVMGRQARNAFCAVRPPGHHAERDRAMGFCLLNNVAIAARYLQERHGLARVLVVDWDVHHGNGTQSIFYDDPSVFYFSTHESPQYPGTGSREERGAGAGLETTLNVPLRAGQGDAEIEAAFREELLPSARKFHPSAILISAGFDAHEDDPLGNLRVSTECYGRLTDLVTGLAADLCEGRVISVLEGGYDLGALGAAVLTHVDSLRATGGASR